jgi:hypothetical protein
MTTQIFNDQGFLTPEGKSFLKDGFCKEVHKVLNTSSTVGDVLIISCILKSIVGEMATNHLNTVKHPIAKSTLKLIKTEVKNNVIPFPGHKGLKEMSTILNAPIDVPPMDQE